MKRKFIIRVQAKEDGFFRKALALISGIVVQGNVIDKRSGLVYFEILARKACLRQVEKMIIQLGMINEVQFYEFKEL